MSGRMPWRKITADQYRKMEDPEDGYDEARILDPKTGFYREVWDVGEHLCAGKVAIVTSMPSETYVDPNYPIEVR